MPAEAKEARFSFGKNWRQYARWVDAARITAAQDGLREGLGGDSLAGARFLDAGCGSGIHSLAARRMGARVVSFDFDPQSVACARELKDRFFPGDDGWQIEEGSVLDEECLRRWGAFDIVYSWGVLHHTGALWKAMNAIRIPLARGGRLFIALYRDQGWVSRWWWAVKRFYNGGPVARAVAWTLFGPYFAGRAVLAGLVRYGHPLGQFRHYHRERGMSLVHDWIDWLGGFPFEVASAESVIAFYKERGLSLMKHLPGRGHGCNQFVFLCSADSHGLHV